MSLLDAIDNFYEHLVVEAVEKTRDPGDGQDFLVDVMCVALNRLPTRYYRHSVDLMFYMADPEYQQMLKAVEEAVAGAREFVQAHRRDM
ncbi:MAG: late competence development ComFB family protein [Marinobacter sp.]|nr:late competence development ComFB family protein [Marinobacter sp.]